VKSKNIILSSPFFENSKCFQNFKIPNKIYLLPLRYEINELDNNCFLSLNLIIIFVETRQK